MAGTFTKQATWLSARYLNDVNDVTAQGAINSVPSGVTATQANQTLPGDRIIFDDAAALAVSDTTVGTLYGGIYMYVQATWTTTAAAVGGVAFLKAADVGATTNTSPQTTNYQVYGDAQPSTSVPSYVMGIFINAVTKNQYCWIQIAGMATVLFTATPTNTNAGHMVVATQNAAGASLSTADNGVTISELTFACQIGVSYAAVTTSGKSLVSILRGFGRL